MDILEQTYTAQDVAQAAGITAKQVTDWANQGQLVGHRDRLGKGRKREFQFHTVMEVATAVALMQAGIRSPADAFAAANKFAHFGDSAAVWTGEKATAPERHPALPYHYANGYTFLFVAGDKAVTHLSPDGSVNLRDVAGKLGRQRGMIAVNLSDVFADVMTRMGGNHYTILDEAYSEKGN